MPASRWGVCAGWVDIVARLVPVIRDQDGGSVDELAERGAEERGDVAGGAGVLWTQMPL